MFPALPMRSGKVRGWSQEVSKEGPWVHETDKIFLPIPRGRNPGRAFNIREHGKLKSDRMLLAASSVQREKMRDS